MEKLFHDILARCRQEQITDILMKEELEIHYRLEDEIVPGGEVVPKELMQWLFTSFNQTDRVREGSERLDFDSAYDYKGRYRINRFTSEGKLCATIRIIRDGIPDLKSLGVSEQLPDLIYKNRGINLVVGKTGSGKSTTLAAVLSRLLEDWPWHIISLEDPVEYHLPAGKGLVTQRELGRDFLSFSEGIKSALRQSPDLLMIGEIRDPNSMRAALDAAESGIGVIATLHSLGASTTLSRIMQMFPGTERDFVRFQLGENLNFIQSQILNKTPEGLKLDYELLIGSPAVKNTILEGNFKQLSNMIFLGQRQGMKNFN
ncbi:MAG: Flp pilus assembly complex ATPase component TadA [Clostridium sp.]|nr:Flp pilus assembly complex ATPase component TadA [Clostridium sp.]